MVHTLQNAFLQFSFNSDTGAWSLIGPHAKGPSIEDAQVNARYHCGLERGLVLGERRSLRMGAPKVVDSLHGPLRQVELFSGLGSHGLSLHLSFALPEEHPLLLWKLTVTNQGNRPVYLDRLDLLNAGFITLPSTFSASSMVGYRSIFRTGRGAARPAPEPGDLAFYSNGWQSWSYTGIYRAGDRVHRTRLGPLRTPLENAGAIRSGRAGLLSSDLFGVLGDRKHRTAILAGFLSQKQHFGSLEVLMDPFSPALRLYASGDGARLDAGQSVETDWACVLFLHLDTADPLAPYLEAVARENNISGLSENVATTTPVPTGPMPTGPVPTGWCSWYRFSSADDQGAIDAACIRENLEAMVRLGGRLPLQVLQIDDGYQAQVGDWLSSGPSFPEGIAPLAAEIRQADLTPGLWLAPFIVHPKSRLAREQPDWLLRNRLGFPANAGFLWNTFTTALDLTHPQALEHTRQVVHTVVHQWGYTYLKLDFLYAAALPGRRHDPRRTRAQALRTGLEALREVAGQQTFLLGCGCPLGSAIGLLDGMRIGADTAEHWYPAYRGHQFFLKGEFNLPSARNACHNALTRASLHRRWWINDPDCLLLHPDTHLTLDEVQAIATVIALTGGSLLLSDHLAGLPEERLRIAECLLPLIGAATRTACHVLDWFDATKESGAATPSRLQLDLDGPVGRWHLLALFNWANRPRNLLLRATDFYLDPQIEYYARSFWDGRLVQFGKDRLAIAAHLEAVPPHGVILLAARPVRSSLPQYLGSDLHISQGLEVVEWKKWNSQARTTQTDGRAEGLSFLLARPGLAKGIIDLALPQAPREIRLNGENLEWQAIADHIYRLQVTFERLGQVTVKF